MLAIVLSDNIADGDFQGEWGFSIYIEYNGKNFLLDTGASNLFVQNANKLGKSIKAVDYAILSHAHYDHSDSMATFFKQMKSANNTIHSFCRKCFCNFMNNIAYAAMTAAVKDDQSLFCSKNKTLFM